MARNHFAKSSTFQFKTLRVNRPLLTQALGCWLPSQTSKMLQQRLGAQMASQL